MLDLYKLDIFTRVVAAGSLTKAAEQLHMTNQGSASTFAPLKMRLAPNCLPVAGVALS